MRGVLAVAGFVAFGGRDKGRVVVLTVGWDKRSLKRLGSMTKRVMVSTHRKD